MKYRIQLNAVFNNVNANSILIYIESIKNKVYKPSFKTIVNIERIAKKIEYVNYMNTPDEYDHVNFDEGVASHIGVHTGDEFGIVIDISFTVQQDYFNVLNYIESIKSNALSGSYIRYCRYFECRHEEIPLTKDGTYGFINFDGEQINHS